MLLPYFSFAHFLWPNESAELEIEIIESLAVKFGIFPTATAVVSVAQADDRFDDDRVPR